MEKLPIGIPGKFEQSSENPLLIHQKNVHYLQMMWYNVHDSNEQCTAVQSRARALRSKGKAADTLTYLRGQHK